MRKSDHTTEELIALVEDQEGTAYGINDSALSQSRTDALNYYQGNPFGNEQEGRSQVVSRDVLDVVESALPQLLKVFVSGDEVVRFDPRNPEDEQAAEQETAAVNYYVMEENDGFAVFSTWFRDALLSKNGYVKVWYEEENDVEVESYFGLTDDQMTLMLQDDRVSVFEHTEYPDPIAQQQMAQANAAQGIQMGGGVLPTPMLHDVKIEIAETKGCIKIDNVAPEDILVGINTKTVSLQDSDFVQHRALMSLEEMEEQGWNIPEGISTYQDSSAWSESNARDLYGEQEELVSGLYLVKDTYIKIDGELTRLVIVGNKIVHQEDAEIIPFACITPHIMPHRHIGMSYADLTMDIQLIKSTLLRGQLDAMYLANQPRFAISDRVSLEDMLTSRPGGVVRVQGEPTTAIMPLQNPAFPPTSFTLVEYMDNAKEKRTGVTAYNQGLDANSLNKTATGVNQIMQATQERILLVARTFANTGVKELFMLVHRLVRKYSKNVDDIKIRDQWVTVDPREWKERKHLKVTVGLGTGNKDQQLVHLQNLLQQQLAMLQMGLPVITPQNIYETVRQLVMNAGFKQPDQFVTNPSQIPPQPPQPNPLIQVEQIKQQGKMQEMQINAQLESQKSQAQLQQEQVRSANDVEIERQKIAAQIELERWKAELDAQTALKKAQMDAEAKIAIEQVKAANQVPPASVSVNNDNAEFTKSLSALMEQQQQNMNMIAELLSRPKQIIRGQDGKAIGVQ